MMTLSARQRAKQTKEKGLEPPTQILILNNHIEKGVKTMLLLVFAFIGFCIYLLIRAIK